MAGAEIFHLLSRLFAYPDGALADQARRCLALVERCDPEAASRLRPFVDFVENSFSGRQEEVYTATFDLNAACHPYVGDQLFGEGFRRSAFMVELKGRYATLGFAPPWIFGNELPDHLGVMLAFLVATEAKGSEAARAEAESVAQWLCPALTKMIESISPNPTVRAAGQPSAEGLDPEGVEKHRCGVSSRFAIRPGEPSRDAQDDSWRAPAGFGERASAPWTGFGESRGTQEQIGGDRRNPYVHLLRAALCFLESEYGPFSSLPARAIDQRHEEAHSG